MFIIQRVIIMGFSLFLLFGALVLLFEPSFPLFLFLIFAVILAILSVLALFISKVIANGIKANKLAVNSLPDQKISDQINPVIFSAKSVFPFELFPDKYVLQEKSLSIIKKKFFFSNEVETISIQDILSSRLFTGPFLVSLTLVRKMPEFPTVELTDLWRSDGIKFKQYLDALILKENKQVQIPRNMTLKSKRKLIYEIGREKEVEKEI